jgi:hypothetical protein
MLKSVYLSDKYLQLKYIRNVLPTKQHNEDNETRTAIICSFPPCHLHTAHVTMLDIHLS